MTVKETSPRAFGSSSSSRIDISIVSLPSSASSFTSTNTHKSSNSPSSISTPDAGHCCVLELSCQKVTSQSSSKLLSTSGINLSKLEPVLSNLTLNFTLF